MCRRSGPQIAVARVAGVGHGRVKEVRGRPTRILMVTAGALGLSDLGVEDRRLSRFALMARQAGCGKRRVDRGGVGRGPAADDVARRTIALSRSGLVRPRIGSEIRMTVYAGVGHRCVEEVGLCPIRIVDVAAGALGLDDLGVEDGRLSRLVLVTRQARGRKRCMERCRVGDSPVVDDVATGTVPKTCGRLMRRRVRSQIAVASVADPRDQRV